MRSVLAAALAVPAVVAAALVGSATTAGAYPYSSVNLVGHGWGHGIGMGQWGALGYAIGQDNGLGPQTYQWILSHYYSPATLQGAANDAQTVRVAMVENNGNDLIAYSPGGVTVPGAGGSAPAVLLRFVPGSGTWQVYTSQGCGGTPTGGGATWGSVVATVTTPPTTQAVGGGPIQLCQGAGNVTVNGQLQDVVNSNNLPRTVNIVALGQYLDGVVPSESIASWGYLGGSNPSTPGYDWGFQELEAQAVAARSYVLSNLGGYGGYADICDTTACQYYPGTANEYSLTNLAVADTAGQVMVMPGGAIATTEYSASTGGYTASSAEGSPFTPVVDDGDAVCVASGTYSCNPNHSWQASIPVGSITGLFPQIGTLSSVTVTARNGLGDLGGRVISVSIVGSASTVQLSGPQFAYDFGLKSDWYAVTAQPSGGVGGYWLSAADGGIFSFGNAPFLGSMGGQHLNLPVVGMAATADHAGYWEVASDGGIFSFGDAAFHGSMGGSHLNRPIVGMAADPATGGYWEVASDGGIFSFGAPFFGSMGGSPLNQPVVGMAPTPDGGGYWLVAADGGIFSFGDARFYGSTGSIHLNRPIVGMAPTSDGGGYWLVAADGGVFTFGDATFAGSAAGTAAGAGAVAILPTATNRGYMVVNGAGAVSSFGDAPLLGDLTTVLPSYGGHVVAGATTPG